MKKGSLKYKITEVLDNVKIKNFKVNDQEKIEKNVRSQLEFFSITKEELKENIETAMCDVKISSYYSNKILEIIKFVGDTKGSKYPLMLIHTITSNFILHSVKPEYQEEFIESIEFFINQVKQEKSSKQKGKVKKTKNKKKLKKEENNDEEKKVKSYIG